MLVHTHYLNNSAKQFLIDSIESVSKIDCIFTRKNGCFVQFSKNEIKQNKQTNVKPKYQTQI